MKKENIVQEENKSEKKAGLFRRITSIVLLVICIALVVGTITCSFIQKDYNPGMNDPDYIKIYTKDSFSSANQSLVVKDSEQYVEIMKLYNNSFKTTFFGALFQGKLFETVMEKDEYKNLSNLTGPYLEFNYSTSQTMFVNGKTYEDYAKERQDKTGVTPIISNTNYISCIVEVLDTDSLTQINVYFKYRDTGLNNYSYIRLMTYAKQSALYDYIESL